MKPWHRIAGALALLAATLFGSAAQAGPPPWPEVSYSYLARSHRLAAVLNSFGRSFGLRVQASAAVEEGGQLVDGTLTATSPTDFMNQLASTYGLAWFYQGGVLHVSRIEEQVTRVLTMPGAGGAALKKALLEVGLIEPKFGWADIADRSAALVSGPPAYVDVLARALADLPMPPLLSDQQLRVFRLRHASVDDRVIFYRDKQIVTTGVANMLRALVAGDGGKTGTNIALAEMAAPLRGSLQPLQAAQPMQGLDADTAGGASRDEKSDERDARPASDGAAPAGGTRRGAAPSKGAAPTVQADSRLNALIIRARPEQLQVYEQLIALLDVPSPLIEIEAVIVDVNKTKVTSLGIDWGARVGSIAGGYGTTSTAADATSATLVRGSGMTPASIVADAGNFLTTRINVLEQEGDARIVSRPTVLTIDNLGALIDLSETFYVSVTSERAANVVPVTVGVTLRVTPHAVDLPDGRKAVHLTVDIEDGTLVTPTVGSIPMVRKSTIGTQAVMGENQSLLVAGFNSERDTKQDDGVPGLRKLPFIGGFFGKKNGDVEKRERLFLITPRIIQSAAAGLPVALPAAQPTVPR